MVCYGAFAAKPDVLAGIKSFVGTWPNAGHAIAKAFFYRPA
jgi:hypothetical protein